MHAQSVSMLLPRLPRLPPELLFCILVGHCDVDSRDAFLEAFPGLRDRYVNYLRRKYGPAVKVIARYITQVHAFGFMQNYNRFKSKRFVDTPTFRAFQKHYNEKQVAHQIIQVPLCSPTLSKMIPFNGDVMPKVFVLGVNIRWIQLNFGSCGVYPGSRNYYHFAGGTRMHCAEFPDMHPDFRGVLLTPFTLTKFRIECNPGGEMHAVKAATILYFVGNPKLEFVRDLHLPYVPWGRPKAECMDTGYPF